ncbi:hypothetical protein [Caudoviricetes sp.]|nr:hypothetical protein [Caudoviricetes sp.]
MVGLAALSGLKRGVQNYLVPYAPGASAPAYAPTQFFLFPLYMLFPHIHTMPCVCTLAKFSSIC